MKTGHTAKLRNALVKGGFPGLSKRIIFNDAKSGPSRKIKLWWADEIFRSSQAAQRKLEQAIREEFGDEILVMYFIERPTNLCSGRILIIQLRPPDA